MRIAIDVRRISSFGIGTHIRNVVRTLARLDQKNHYVLIGISDLEPAFGRLPENFLPVVFPHLERSVRNYFEFYGVVRQYDCDLVHVPHLFWRPRYMPLPYVLTAHDLQSFLHPREGNTLDRKSVV